MPFLVVITRWVVTKGKQHFLIRILTSPFWLLSGFIFAILDPFVVLWYNLSQIPVVLKAEWALRFLTGRPKKPNGHPYEFKSADVEDALDSAITKSVIVDYNDEAREHGQGIELEDNGNE